MFALLSFGLGQIPILYEVYFLTIILFLAFLVKLHHNSTSWPSQQQNVHLSGEVFPN